MSWWLARLGNRSQITPEGNIDTQSAPESCETIKLRSCEFYIASTKDMAQYLVSYRTLIMIDIINHFVDLILGKRGR